MQKSTQNCESQLCCRATASLDAEVEQELTAPDKSIADVLDQDIGCEKKEAEGDE